MKGQRNDRAPGGRGSDRPRRGGIQSLMACAVGSSKCSQCRVPVATAEASTPRRALPTPVVWAPHGPPAPKLWFADKRAIHDRRELHERNSISKTSELLPGYL
jgi:hypothetical protein